LLDNNLKNQTLSNKIEINKEAIEQDGDSKLSEGEKLSIKDLLYLSLIESSNDAAFALTEPFGEKKFVELMNKNAKMIGLKNTRYFNPTGLEPDDPKKPINYSTAEDLVKLANYIIKKYPQIFEITKQPSYKIVDLSGKGKYLTPKNTDKLLKQIPGIIGGKTGWTPKAGGCLLLVLKNPDRENSYFINVVLGSSDRFGDMKKIIKALNIED